MVGTAGMADMGAIKQNSGGEAVDLRANVGSADRGEG